MEAVVPINWSTFELISGWPALFPQHFSQSFLNIAPHLQ